MTKMIIEYKKSPLALVCNECLMRVSVLNTMAMQSPVHNKHSLQTSSSRFKTTTSKSLSCWTQWSIY